jgi:hypothetical protein
VAALKRTMARSWGRFRRQGPAHSDPFFQSPVFDSLRDSLQCLQQSTASIENAFLAVGAALEKLPDASEDLVRQSGRLLVLASGPEEGDNSFNAAMQLIESPLRFVERSHVTLVDLIRRLREAEQHIGELIASEASLQRAVAPLTYIQTIFRIECASLPVSVQQMFASLTEDIDRLQKQLTQTFGEKFDQLRAAQGTIRRVNTRLRDSAQSQGVAITEKRASVERSLAELQTDLSVKETRNHKLVTASAAIRDLAGRLVMSLQAQDIVNQKLAHIVRAVEAILKHRESMAEGDDPLPAAHCAVSSRLQAAQLEGVAADLRGSLEEIRDATSQVRAWIRQMDEECLCLRDVTRMIASVDGLVQVMLNTLAEVRGMVTQTLELSEQAYDSIRPIGGIATILTGVMLQLSSRIRLIALNAQVQAAHNSGGTGLEVLASQTASVATETSTISESVASGIDSLTADLGHLVEAFDGLRAGARESRAVMDTEGRAREDELHAVRDRTLEALNAVSGSVRNVLDLVNGMTLQSLEGLAGRGPLGELSRALGAAASESEGFLARQNIVPERAALSAELCRHYSVASELEIHRRFFGEAGPVPADAEPVPTGAFGPGADNDRGGSTMPADDNITLF